MRLGQIHLYKPHICMPCLEKLEFQMKHLEPTMRDHSSNLNCLNTEAQTALPAAAYERQHDNTTAHATASPFRTKACTSLATKATLMKVNFSPSESNEGISVQLSKTPSSTY